MSDLTDALERFTDACGKLHEAVGRVRDAAQRLEGGESEAVSSIATERNRQVNVEGWTAEHDDRHRAGEMAMAAACYAMFAEAGYRSIDPPEWPWDRAWWKPADHRRNLVKAGALIVAEIERLDRAALEAAAKAREE